ncbi:LRR receptor-like serine/threonine-protein kinase EFR [Linum perenne]
MQLFTLPPLFLLLLSCLISLTTSQTDEQALLDFKSKISSDPLEIFPSWNSSFHFCQWHGVTCDLKTQRVIKLTLSSSSIHGSISPSITNLTSLQQLHLDDNTFSGHIPIEIGSLSALRILNLHSNSLTGEIPPTISNCSSLTALSLGRNKLVGRIPDSLGNSLSNLRMFMIDFNNLTGGLPPSMGNVSSLELLSTTSNNLGGTIPESLGKLDKLDFFTMGANMLTGTIPSSIYNISSVSVLCFPENQLHGTIPTDVGNVLPKLIELNIGDNRFTGMIPASLSNATNLERFTIAINGISGTLPSLDKLHKLWWLSISTNLLGTGLEGDLDFFSTVRNLTSLQLVSISYNNFGGSLPHSVVNLTQLEILAMGLNNISGTIPVGMSNLKRLEWLDMGDNQFTGTIPEALGMLERLKKLYLQGNRFSGSIIPSSLGNLTQLTHLYMHQSSIEGSIPPSLGKCQNLLLLDLDGNNLTGEIPGEIFNIASLTIYLGLADNSLSGSLPRQVGSLKNLGNLNVSYNLLSGEIPASIGSCVRLETLLLRNNSFEGVIPSSMSSLKGIQVLSVAYNNLSGEIPEFMGRFQSLTRLNLAFNNFQGSVPSEGVFMNSTTVSVSGNRKLCGGIPEYQLPPCSIISEEAKSKRLLSVAEIAIIAVCSFVFLALLVSSMLLFFVKRRRVQPDPECEASQMTYHSLRRATEEFSPRNLVGTGGFGSVYKGIDQENGKPIAVKVLNLVNPAASKSFRAECEVLRTVRHRNLVKLLTACSGVDAAGNEFKALVYEFMVNGSLEEWLHPDALVSNPTRRLNFIQRLNIAIDVASALEYLHRGLKTPIVHCDLKPSNVLLNDEMTGLVADFGLARLFPETTNMSYSINSLSSSIGVRGTIGYTAPEYGMGNEVSTTGDVYSYGMLLLEMFTGKRPTDEMFKEGMNLHGYGKVGSWKEAREIMDTLLVEEIEESSSEIKECVVSILGVGVAASTEWPGERMRISEVARELCEIREKLDVYS